MESQTVVVTGASGFIGRWCCQALRDAGFTVRALVRDPDRARDLEDVATGGIYSARLPDQIDPAAFQPPVRAVVHCAYETRFEDRERAYATNVEGTRELLKLSRQAGAAQFIFLSSLSAMPEAESFYGQSKLQMEQLLDPSRDLVLRLGMVVGPSGMFSRMRDTIRKGRVAPLFYGGRQQIQTVWIGDLCAVIVRAIQTGLTGLYAVAEPESVSMRTFFSQIAALYGKKPLFVPLPGAPILALLRVLERLGLRLPVSSENLLGLKHLRAHDVTADLQTIGVPLRPFRELLAELSRLEAPRQP